MKRWTARVPADSLRTRRWRFAREHRIATERIVGRENFAAIQARYPTNTGRWSFDVHRIVAEEDIVVSEVTVTDEEQAARVVAFSILEGSQIAHQIEYWPMPYDPQPGRADLTQPITRIP